MGDDEKGGDMVEDMTAEEILDKPTEEVEAAVGTLNLKAMKLVEEGTSALAFPTPPHQTILHTRTHTHTNKHTHNATHTYAHKTTHTNTHNATTRHTHTHTHHRVGVFVVYVRPPSN